MNIADLETPEVLVDHDRLLNNIERARDIAAKHSVALRPHIKTHKCVEIARLQLQHGAVGLTASKVDEALVFIESGNLTSVTIAYPVVDRRKLRRLFDAAREHGVEVLLAVDSDTGCEAIQAAATNEHGRVGVFVKIDVGLHRCGVDAHSAELLPLVEQIARSGRTKFGGLLAHAGHAYAARDLDEIRAVARRERELLQSAVERVQAAGIAVPAVSVGSTPTVLASESYEGISEIRPGNYVFLDGTALRLGIATADDIALSVIATVVSRNNDYLIIDAGSKVLSSDRGPHGTGGANGYGIAFPLTGNDEAPLQIARLSEEHGFVERKNSALKIGTKVRIVPNHACPVANLAERLTMTSRDEVIHQWPAAARAKVR